MAISVLLAGYAKIVYGTRLPVPNSRTGKRIQDLSAMAFPIIQLLHSNYIAWYFPAANSFIPRVRLAISNKMITLLSTPFVRQYIITKYTLASYHLPLTVGTCITRTISCVKKPLHENRGRLQGCSFFNNILWYFWRRVNFAPKNQNRTFSLRTPQFGESTNNGKYNLI